METTPLNVVCLDSKSTFKHRTHQAIVTGSKVVCIFFDLISDTGLVAPNLEHITSFIILFSLFKQFYIDMKNEYKPVTEIFLVHLVSA